MKKILGLLGSMALVVPASSSIVSCKNEISESVKKLEFANGKSVNDLVNFANNGYIDKANKKNLKDSVCLSKDEDKKLSDEERKILKGAGDIWWFSSNASENGMEKFINIKNLFKDLNNICYIGIIDKCNEVYSFFSVDDAKIDGSTFTLKLIQIHVKISKINENDVKFTHKGCKILYKTTIDLKQMK